MKAKTKTILKTVVITAAVFIIAIVITCNGLLNLIPQVFS